MSRAHSSAIERRGARRALAAFTLIELLVGMLVGLVTTLGVTYAFMHAEGKRRTVAMGNDAQVNGALALAGLRTAVESAGYGINQVPGLFGCKLTAMFKGKTYTALPANLAPVVITPGANGKPDTIRVFASGKKSFAVPLRLTAEFVPGAGAASQAFTAVSTFGVTPSSSEFGDLLLAGAPEAPGRPGFCETFTASAVAAAGVLSRVDDGLWNRTNFPENKYPVGSFVVNLGRPVDLTYSITSRGALAVKSLQISDLGEPSVEGPRDLYTNVVNLKALYGLDSATPTVGTVDKWTATTPTDNVGWRRLFAVRMAVVARSVQYEREEVTVANPQWNIGRSVTTDAATVACRSDASSLCIDLQVDQLPNWKHYRYKVYDTVVPIRNMVWKED